MLQFCPVPLSLGLVGIHLLFTEEETEEGNVGNVQSCAAEAVVEIQVSDWRQPSALSGWDRAVCGRLLWEEQLDRAPGHSAIRQVP